ncbi:prepilin peptidase [Micromonospora sp. 15K316]|uniref:prepilin peptidase n=1 Tax=Micromonospora sp. 15K316 TaxID=2530376 RepID=UPI001048054C|nr:A24 family peptidase [Micromonospora sp. 15K316]TDC37458.1 prepilin peptidase [Micromonospora sp. 15K316]
MSAGPLTVVVLLGVLAGSATPALAGRFVVPGPPPARVARLRLRLAAAGGVAFGGLAAARGHDPALPVFLVIAAVGLALCAVDLACLRLPDPLVATVAAAGVLGLGAVAAVGGDPGRLSAALAGVAISLAVYVLLALLPGSRLGFGDVKLAAALALPLGWLGWSALAWGLALPHVLGGLWALAQLAAGRMRRDTGWPFGPAILAGAWLAALLP